LFGAGAFLRKNQGGIMSKKKMCPYYESECEAKGYWKTSKKCPKNVNYHCEIIPTPKPSKAEVMEAALDIVIADFIKAIGINLEMAATKKCLKNSYLKLAQNKLGLKGWKRGVK
jgi:hypothetical protein